MTADKRARLESRYLQMGDTTIHYQVAGEGRPVVLVHGLSGSTRWWARNVGPLAERFRVYVVDLIGFGGSRAASRFALREATGHLVRWMDRLALDRASVIGHSMGGFIAADLAADVPARVDHLVLVDAVALPLGRTRWRQAVGLLHGLWRLPVGFLPILLADAHRAGPATILRAAHELLAADIQAKLARVAAPTLLIWGERDAIVPVELGERLARALPRARLVVLPGAGHNPMWDRADAFNRAVLAFLAEERPARAVAAARSAA
ncbi:MAG TPA: alpha/beta fold hydrolase [Chloroflexota bacterium]|nr:alpha/beta fold hydrolase [Chloroflexota bacterium]